VVRKIREDEDFARAIPLENVFTAEEWRHIIPPSKYVLVKVSMHDFLMNGKNLVLSYRWDQKIKVKCGGIAPGKIRLPKQERELAIDFVRGLPYINEGGSLWVDFLCHLDVDRHRREILNKMGELYTRGVVLPLYLLDFVKMRNSEALMISLRRGWIQQEISYGELHKETTKLFVNTCIESGYFGELATFLRRRIKALNYLTESYDKEKTEGVCLSFGRRTSVDLLESEAYKDLANIPDPFKTVIEKVEWIADIPHLCGLVSQEKGQTDRRMASILSKVCKHISESTIKNLCCEVAKAQTFDSKDFVSAVRLIRAFSESPLFNEEDVFVATLQCAARASNLKWNDSCRIQTEILRKCWRTVFDNINNVKDSSTPAILKFDVRREHKHATGLGIFLVLPRFLEKSRGEVFTIHIRDKDIYMLFKLEPENPSCDGHHDSHRAAMLNPTYEPEKESTRTLKGRVYIISGKSLDSGKKTKPDKSFESVESLFELGLKT